VNTQSPLSASAARLRPAGIVLATAAAGCSLLVIQGCSRKKEVPAGFNASRPVTATEAARASEFAASLPHVGGPAGYVGSKNCRDCHQDQFESWHRSYHRTMTQIASTNTVRAGFHDVVLTNDGTRFILSRKEDEFRVRMERESPSPGAGALESVDTRVGLVTGSHHMQVFWVPGDVPNTQIGFPFTWLIPERRWVTRNSTFVRPPDMVHRSEIWNVVCSRCHATGIEPRVNGETRTVDTRAGELGIACEACHGPGQRHVERRQAESAAGPAPDAQTLRNEIVHPKKIEPGRAAQICGFCHSMKWIGKSEPWTQNGFHYRPGDDLEQSTPIIRPSRVDSIPELADFLSRNPDLLHDFFWPDGMIRVSGREYNGLLESPCYRGGKFSCLSCHSLHDSDPDDQLARSRTDNRACTQCHEQFRAEEALAGHTRHPADSSGSQCYNCHMPFTTYGVLKAIRSHQVSSPRVSDDLATGRPNACNLCHLDQTLAWTAERLGEWFQHPVPKLPENATTTAHAVRLALSGDAGQRALITWHLSWPPALQISGTNWIPFVLGQLLDDPYAAVRCIAARSLTLVPGLVPPDYDFVVDPRSRKPVRSVVWEAWQRQPGAARTADRRLVIRPDDLGAQRVAFDQWLRLRDDRTVRLRE
jgi:predicted CXXCH cytochrome family protein